MKFWDIRIQIISKYKQLSKKIHLRFIKYHKYLQNTLQFYKWTHNTTNKDYFGFDYKNNSSSQNV